MSSGKAVNVMMTYVVEQGLGSLPRNVTQKDFIAEAVEPWLGFDQKHVDFLIKVTSLEKNLWLPEDYESYLENLADDEIAAKWIPAKLFVGYGGSRAFGQEFRKIKGKEFKTKRKTVWMDESISESLDDLKKYFGLKKSQLFDLLIRFHLRVSGRKEEIDNIHLKNMSVGIESMMLRLNEHFEDIKHSLKRLQEDYPEHFEFSDWSEDRLDFNDPEDGLSGWDGVISNFPVLMNSFRKYVLENSEGLKDCFE